MRPLLAILLFFFCVFLTGCFFVTIADSYAFYQSFENIEMIEIVKTNNADDDNDLVLETVSVLDEDEHRNLVNQILEAEGNYVLEGAVFKLGTYIIRITYRNGAVELIGEWSYRHISDTGMVSCGCYWFDNEHFYAIISRYAGQKYLTD